MPIEEAQSMVKVAWCDGKGQKWAGVGMGV